MSNQEADYLNDTRRECKYGINCYQKNAKHLEQYKHPPKSTEEQDSELPPTKKFKPNTTNIKLYAPTDIAESYNENITDPKENDTKNIADTIVSAETQSETDVKNLKTKETASSHDNTRVFIKDKFLIEMPEDFYKFWDFCKTLKPDNPLIALAQVNLTLVGPYEVLAGELSNSLEDEKYLLHWRYFHDPPEFQTVIKGGDANGFHIGYFRDEPHELPVFLAYNSANVNGEFVICGENVFAAIYNYIKDSKKSLDPFKKMAFTKYENLVKKEAEKLSLSLAEKTENIKKRNKKVVTKTFNKLGVVVPYDKKTQVGYRELAMSDKELKKLFDRLAKDESNKDRILAELQPVFMFTNLALDECDFGTGLELGLNILAHGVKTIDATALRYLRSSYKLLNRDEFARIAEVHLKYRKQGTDLSISE